MLRAKAGTGRAGAVSIVSSGALALALKKQALPTNPEGYPIYIQPLFVY
jgi:hypothetical protein